jgi:hypothetical protein
LAWSSRLTTASNVPTLLKRPSRLWRRLAKSNTNNGALANLERPRQREILALTRADYARRNKQ